MPGLLDSMRYKADQAALEADKLMRIRREQAAIDQLRRQVRVQMDALGQAAFTAYRNGEIAHPRLVAIGQQIDALTEQIAQHEARIEQIRAERLMPMPPVPPPPGPTVACPHCGQRIPAQAAFCPYCGFQMPKLPPAAAVCASCGSSLPAGAQFCPVCGARQAPATPPPPQTIRCSGCGAELPAVAVFCPDCGMRVSGAVSYAPPPEPVSTAWRPPEPRESPAPASETWTSGEATAPIELGSEGEPWSDEDQASMEAVSAAATKRCPVCEAEILTEAAFCPECGAQQEGVG